MKEHSLIDLYHNGLVIGKEDTTIPGSLPSKGPLQMRPPANLIKDFNNLFSIPKSHPENQRRKGVPEPSFFVLGGHIWMIGSTTQNLAVVREEC